MFIMPIIYFLQQMCRKDGYGYAEILLVVRIGMLFLRFFSQTK